MRTTWYISLIGVVLSNTLTAFGSTWHNGTYQNPVRRYGGPDPSMVYVDGAYHLTYTSDTHIQITRSPTLNGLADGDTRTIWTDSNVTRSAHLWAPEIHQIDDVWYMFYSSCRGDEPCCGSCQTRILQGCGGPNPYDCEYDHLADLVPPPGRQGGRYKNETFSIDGTFLEIPGRGRYHVMSALNEGGLQSIQITELDTDTWTVSGWNVISSPDQAVCYLHHVLCPGRDSGMLM